MLNRGTGRAIGKSYLQPGSGTVRKSASHWSPSSRGPGPRLFTPLTRVRIPSGTPPKAACWSCKRRSPRRSRPAAPSVRQHGSALIENRSRSSPRWPSLPERGRMRSCEVLATSPRPTTVTISSRWQSTPHRTTIAPSPRRSAPPSQRRVPSLTVSSRPARSRTSSPRGRARRRDEPPRPLAPPRDCRSLERGRLADGRSDRRRGPLLRRERSRHGQARGAHAAALHAMIAVLNSST